MVQGRRRPVAELLLHDAPGTAEGPNPSSSNGDKGSPNLTLVEWATGSSPCTRRSAKSHRVCYCYGDGEAVQRLCRSVVKVVPLAALRRGSLPLIRWLLR